MYALRRIKRTICWPFSVVAKASIGFLLMTASTLSSYTPTTVTIGRRGIPSSALTGLPLRTMTGESCNLVRITQLRNRAARAHLLIYRVRAVGTPALLSFLITNRNGLVRRQHRVPVAYRPLIGLTTEPVDTGKGPVGPSLSRMIKAKVVDPINGLVRR